MCCHLAMTSANGLIFLFRYGRKTVTPVSCIFSVTLSRGNYKNPAKRHLKNSPSKVKLLNAVCPKTSPKRAEKRVRAQMKNARDKFIVIIINWSLIGSCFALAPYCSFSILSQVQNSFIITIFLFPAKWEIKSILQIRLYLNNDELLRTTNYSLLFRSRSVCRTLPV